MTPEQTQRTPLADHLIDNLYAPWKRNRKRLEERWLANWEAFRGIVTGTWKAGEGTGWRSQANINVTRQKVIAAFSLILQQVVRGGRIAYSIHADRGNPWTYSMLGDEAQERLDEDSRLMEQCVDDELAACDAEKQYARNLLVSAVYGETFAKASVTVAEETKWRPVVPDGVDPGALAGIDPAEVAWEPYVEERERFAWLAVTPWEIVRDLEDDNIQTSTGLFHCRPMSAYWLRQRIGKPGSVDAAIKRVLSKARERVAVGGAATATDSPLPPGMKAIENRGNRIDYREFHGRVPRQLAEDFERKLAAAGGGVEGDAAALEKPGEMAGDIDKTRDDGDEVECIVGMADEEVVFFVRAEPGRRPFERAVWEEALDDVGGVGVADAVSDIHRAMTGAFRAFEDLSKAASTLILVLREALVTNPEDISKGIQAGFLKLQLRPGPQSMSDAIQQLKIENAGQNVLPLIDYLKAFLEEESLVPQISHGISTAGEGRTTAYEISTRVERAGTYIGMVVRNHDEGLTEPMVERIVRRFMEDPDFSGPRGNFTVSAQGFAGFDQRNTKLAAIYRLLELALNSPVLLQRLKLDKPLAEIAGTLDMDPGDVWRTDAEMEQAQQQTEAAAQAEAIAEDNESAAKADLSRAQAEKTRNDAALDTERLKIERAKAIRELESGVKEDARADAEAASDKKGGAA